VDVYLSKRNNSFRNKISAVKNAKRQEYEDKIPKNERYKLFFLKARR